MAVLLRPILMLSALLSAAQAAELSASFPNHAISLQPATPQEKARAIAQPRINGRSIDETQPFTWDQNIVVGTSSSISAIYQGFDPGRQPIIAYLIPPVAPINVTIPKPFDSQYNVQYVNTLATSGGKKESFDFFIRARNIDSPKAKFTYDIRSDTTALRASPFLVRSSGEDIRPGQIVRFAWTSTSRTIRYAYCEAELTGRTGTAKGLSSSTITSVLGVKAQPFVLGHYLMVVTPRDVRGEPARGSNSNGQVFHCAFGSANLPPASDGFFADTFTPDVNQTIQLKPNATDPESGQTEFTKLDYDFGDMVPATNVSGAVTHSYSTPGIYRVRCRVYENSANPLSSIVEDSVVVGATQVNSIAFNFIKNVPPLEGGIGTEYDDSFSATFTDPLPLNDPGRYKAKPGDRVVFLFNRNHFGKAHASDLGDDTDIILNNANSFAGKTRIANSVTVSAANGRVVVSVKKANLDRTGDPRLGRCELVGIFGNNRIAVAVIPANGSTPRVLLYTGNIRLNVKGGTGGVGFFNPEEKITGLSTLKDPDPLVQEPY